jgi:hypothetical protein
MPTSPGTEKGESISTIHRFSVTFIVFVLRKAISNALLKHLYRLVEFADRRGMEYALDKLDNTELDGRKIRITEEGRGGGGGGGGRRSYSRSR